MSTTSATTTTTSPQREEEEPTELTTVVGVVEAIEASDEGEGWWEYRLVSGKTLVIPRDVAPGCSAWLDSATSGDSTGMCAVVALVDESGVVTLLRDLDTNIAGLGYAQTAGGRSAGLLAVTDFSRVGPTDLVTIDGFAFDVASGAIRECDPSRAKEPVGYHLLVDLDTSEVFYLGCLAYA